ncbi:MAG TPA: diguanylate cyclase [Gallionellaceae bacterium]|nr:diguanylate cyclase [Gallionellaceae bacterium]
MSQSDQVAGRILVVDDSATVGMVVKNAISGAVGMPVDLARSLAACGELIAEHPGQYQVAVVDLNLPDAVDGQAVDMVLGYGVATIVLTGSMDSTTHDRISAKPIVDYVTKQSPGSIAIVQKSVLHTLRNMQCTVLIVDDNLVHRNNLKKILLTQRLHVVEADSANAALQAIEKRGDISVVVTAYEMPETDGVDLCMKLRANFPSTKLAIIGITGSTNDFGGVRFFKAGADDIIHKPFLVEEFVSRINARLDYLDSLRTIQEQANRDYLTKLYNRRYLFEAGNALFSSAKRGHIQLLIAMIDIDLFKRINDTYGHDTGDKAIVSVAQAITRHFRTTDIVARMGGEEFCIIAVNNNSVADTMNRLRLYIEGMPIHLDEKESIRLTVSIGVTTTLPDTLDEMINRSDEALYTAKQNGRNQVVSI